MKISGRHSLKTAHDKFDELPNNNCTKLSTVPASSRLLATTNRTPMARTLLDWNPDQAWASDMQGINDRRQEEQLKEQGRAQSQE